MTRLDWEKAKRREKRGRRRPKGSKRKTAWDRQIAMIEFVAKHQLVCFACKAKARMEWAKTGVSRRGPWAICSDCVKKR